MLKTGKRINSRRCYSDEFKRKVVSEYERGTMSVPQLANFYDIAYAVIYRWIYKYSDYNKKNVVVVEMKNSQLKKLEALEQKVKELERMVGQKQIMIDYLEKMIDLAQENFAIDIKKNFNTPHSGGSKPTKKP